MQQSLTKMLIIIASLLIFTQAYKQDTKLYKNASGDGVFCREEKTKGKVNVIRVKDNQIYFNREPEPDLNQIQYKEGAIGI